MLVGNPQKAAGIEMTLQGGTFLFPEGATIALGGSDFGSALWTTQTILPGQSLTLGRSQSGARCYLCIRGGIQVPLILGSASTDIVSGLGGRPLRRGDILEIGPAPTAPPRRTLHPGLLPMLTRRDVFRVTDGPQHDWFTNTLYDSVYTVTSDANRMGIRLSGPPLQATVASQLITEGVSLGCIQVPAGGQPVILFVEQQTTGGYPKIANVIAADLPALGQLKPGDKIRFQRVGLREARELLYMQERWMASPDSFL